MPRTPSSIPLSGVHTLADLRRALDEKEKSLLDLVERKDRLAREIEDLGEVLTAMLSGSRLAPGRSNSTRARSAEPKARAKSTGRKAAKSPVRGARAPRTGSLPVFIRSVLEPVLGPMRVHEVVTAIVKAGYPSKSKTLAQAVAARLSQMPEIERVDRGLYQLRRDATGTLAATIDEAKAAGAGAR